MLPRNVPLYSDRILAHFVISGAFSLIFGQRRKRANLHESLSDSQKRMQTGHALFCELGRFLVILQQQKSPDAKFNCAHQRSPTFVGILSEC